MTISKSTIDFLKPLEGCRLKAYQLSGDVPTIGYGHTGKDVYLGLTISQEKADELFYHDLQTFGKAVDRNVTAAIDQNMFDALVSFVYNRGEGNFRKTRLLKLLNALKYEEAAEAFLDTENWNFTKFSEQIRNSLRNRRLKEKKLFETNLLVKDN